MEYRFGNSSIYLLKYLKKLLRVELSCLRKEEEKYCCFYLLLYVHAWQLKISYIVYSGDL